MLCGRKKANNKINIKGRKRVNGAAKKKLEHEKFFTLKNRDGLMVSGLYV